MPCNHIQPLDFSLGNLQSLNRHYWELELPRKWLEGFQSLATNRSGHRVSLPTKVLESACRLLEPRLMFVLVDKVPSGLSLRLGAWEPIPQAVLVNIFRMWVREGFRRYHPSSHSVEAVENQLDSGLPDWAKRDFNFALEEPEVNGTANLSSTNYKLIRNLICSLVAIPQCSIEIGDVKFNFRQVLTNDGPELVSWPPVSHSYGGVHWYWSYAAIPKVETNAFQSHPVLRFTFRIRRWVSKSLVSEKGFLSLPFDATTTAYILVEESWLDGRSLTNPVFVPASLKLKYQETDGKMAPKVNWATPLEGIMDWLPDRLPDAELLVREPEKHLRDPKVPIAILYSNRMHERHAVKPGIVPVDRRDLFKGLRDLLAPYGLTPEKKLSREKPMAMPKMPLRAGYKHWCADKALKSLRNLSGQILQVEIWSEEENSEIQRLLMEGLGEIADSIKLEPVSPQGTGKEVYSGFGFSLELIPKQIGILGSKLANNERSTRNRKTAYRKLTRDRALKISEQLDTGQGRVLSLIELRDKDAFKIFEDPKTAIRWGFAKTGRITQFLTPIREEEKKNTVKQRVRSSILDLFRQSGFLPGAPNDHISKWSFPHDVQLLGLWVVQHDKWNKCLPVLVRIDSSGGIEAVIPGNDGWQSYSEVLVTAAQRQEDLGIRSETCSQFVERTLAAFGKNEPMLLICNAKNARRHLSWLKNGEMARDMCDWNRKVANSPTQGLRIARIRDEYEAPQWIAEQNDDLMVTSGIFRNNVEATFLSLQDKPPNMKGTSAKTYSKTVNPFHSASLPQAKELVLLLQKGDEPTHWATLVHRLREMAPHYNSALGLPLPLHLAKQVQEYVEVMRG